MIAKEMLELADAGMRHAEGLTAQLDKSEWKPGRAHIEQSRNSIRKLAESLRLAAQSDAAGDGPVAWPQPIATAPSDGTEFIGYENGDVYRCCWRTEHPDEGRPGHSGWYDFSNQSFENPTEWSPLRYTANEPQTARDRIVIASALAEKWPGDYAFGDPAEGANELAFETADIVLAALSGKPGGQAGEDGR